MAIFKTLLASLLLSLFLLCFAESSDPTMVIKDVVDNSFGDEKIDCGQACAVRCQLSSRPNLCKRACGTCCFRCNCVPPGTYNNYDMCPCYRDMTGRDGRRKCP